MPPYPGLSHVVEGTFLSHSRDVVPLEAGHEYRINLNPTHSTSHTRWDYGRKWHAKIEDFAISRKNYALKENVNGRNPPRPVEIRCVEIGTFRVGLTQLVSCCRHFLTGSRQFKNRPIAINVPIGGLHRHTQRHLNKHCTPCFPTAMFAARIEAKGILNAHRVPSSASPPVHTAKHPRRRSTRSSAARTETSCCNSTMLRTAPRCRTHWSPFF
jgi:hypothetical protein